MLFLVLRKYPPLLTHHITAGLLLSYPLLLLPA